MSTEYKTIIEAHLKMIAERDEVFAVKYQNPKKSLNECCAYILSQARKLGSAVCVKDEVVYGWAMHYYDEDNVQIDITSLEPTTKEVVKPAVKATKKREPDRIGNWVQLSLFD